MSYDKFPSTPDAFESALVEHGASYEREGNFFFFREHTSAHRFMYCLDPGMNCVFMRDVFDPDGTVVTRISYEH